MAGDRPTPRYGELAPEGWVWSPPVDPQTAGPDAASDNDSAGDNDGAGDRPTNDRHRERAEVVPAQPYRIADATISVFLLVTAVMLSTSIVPTLFDLRSMIDMFYADRGLGEYGGGSAVDIAGAIAAISQLVLLAASIWLTVRLIGQRRRSWPVPLLIGALAMIVIFGCLVLALVADPRLIAGLSAS